jgi:exopolyphosphatase/guanosine-5'-triphosphate,3'-diphosphate pyrophosphatase
LVPRWEWRSYAEDFDVPASAEARESDELYVLSRESTASVKFRDGKLDVKRLESLGDGGLERWRPVLRAAPPLASPEVASMLAELGVAGPTLARPEYTLDELLAEVVGPDPDLLAVEVQKRRQHFSTGGCMAELAEIRTAHGTRWTLVVESEDPELVSAAVRELGYDTGRNVNLPRILKALTGFDAHRYGVIDVGTNSVKFVVAERAADGEWRFVVDRAEVTRLGEGLDQTGELKEEPIERTVDVVAGMADEARAAGAEAIVAVGTAGLRIARNRSVFLERVHERAGIPVEVIPGEEEARLAFLAVASSHGLGSGTLAVFDTGGGSSQFTFGRDGRIEEQFSVDVGAARFTERYGLDGVVGEGTLAEALDAIAADLGMLDGRPAPDIVVAMGGAVTNLAAVKLELARYDPDVVRGTILDRAEIERQLELYRARTAEERREIVGLQPKRAEVILAGACIVRTVLAKLGRDSLTVSDRGLRHGLPVDRFGR